MSDGVAYAVAEAINYALARVVGRTFRVEPRRAQEIATYGLLWTLIIVAIVVTVLYS